MPENYKMIEEVKDRAVRRTGDSAVITNEDMVGKIEWREGESSYYGGFVDYHGPKGYRDRMDDPNGDRL